MTGLCCWSWLWLILGLCLGRTSAQGAAAPFPSVCPVALQPGQVASVARSCSNVSIRDEYVCCASALVELRVSLAEASTAFHVSTVRGAACLQDLNSALQANSGDAQANFQTCNITARDIFRASVRSCNGIASVETVREILLEQKVDFEVIREACVKASTMCARCRRAVLDATYVLATTGGAAMRSNVLQCCTDLVFLALASNFSQVTGSEIGSCLFIPTDTPPQNPPPESPVTPSISPSIKDAVPESKVLVIRSVVVLAICIALTSLALFLLIMLVIIIFQRRTLILCPHEEMPLTGGKLKRMKGPNFRRDCGSRFRHFKFQEIQRATDNFSTIIGRGGFGTVYKARFKDGLVAAVKRMNKGSSQGEQEFCKEMELLGRLHHRNLVSLRGYCADRCHERFLVYEYCENGSLKEHLHGAHPLEPGQAKLALTWRKRLQIALDVATGLEYLHSFCEPPLCHRDIKSSNILLSEKFTARIADFGLAQAGRNGDAFFEPVTTEVHGTPGCMDPEYAEPEELTEKSDVYSFGVLLLELVTGRRADNDNNSLVNWAQKYMDNVESKTAFFVDSELERHEYTLDELKLVISIIKQCIQINGKLRPKMGQIVRRLQLTTLEYSSSQSSLSSGHFVSAGSCVGAIAESEEPEQPEHSRSSDHAFVKPNFSTLQESFITPTL